MLGVSAEIPSIIVYNSEAFLWQHKAFLRKLLAFLVNI